MWNSFLHFCKANNACCGKMFTLSKLTVDEQEIMNKLNSVMLKAGNDRHGKSEQPEISDLKAVQDRLEKLNLLMKQME